MGVITAHPALSGLESVKDHTDLSPFFVNREEKRFPVQNLAYKECLRGFCN